ncbi:MAG TPA: hypothetical protein VEY89_06525 [Candidatus Dormibacteraeota bacterium]|nr:hypothetical protein [Candidatus Dormibacteraeota bacterium]
MSLLLVFAQHGAVLHELGHLSLGDRGHTPAARAHLPADSTCATCEAFAQIANPASGAAATLTASAAVYLPIPAPVYAIIAADTPTPRSRGPPQA